MRLFKLFLIPVLLVTGSIASGQEPSAMKLQGRARISGEWASSPAAPGPMLVPTGGVEAAPVPAAVLGAPVNAPVYGTPMGQCGAGGCGAACETCAKGCCLTRLKDWFCSRPLHACDKQVCYDPVPPLYQFFPCPREGYCPRLAPPTCCPAPARVVHPICSNRQPWANTYCGGCGCGATCGKAACGTPACGAPACESCSACESGRASWTRFFRPLRCSSCKDHCCTPSAQCFTNGQITGGCADGSCGPK